MHDEQLSHEPCSPRREFLGQLGLIAITATVSPTVARAESRAAPDWDMSWVERVAAAPYKALVARGVMFLVCNRATMGLASTLAKKVNKPVEEVQNDLRANVVPGATLMPNGVFALIRAQNAGCAFYRQA